MMVFFMIILSTSLCVVLVKGSVGWLLTRVSIGVISKAYLV